MKEKSILLLLPALLLQVGCAGSASHKVVQNDPVADSSLSCRQADAEILRAQSIITAVNEDKADISGADVMDGILWFPFNLIAKDSNYNNALNAANQRIVMMKQIKRDKNCPTDVADAESGVKQASVESKIRELNNLYKDGLLSEQEYMDKKKKVLDSI